MPAPDIRDAIVENTDVCRESTYRTKCYYRCRKNYKMVSVRNFIQCTENGTWDIPLPRCDSKFACLKGVFPSKIFLKFFTLNYV